VRTGGTFGSRGAGRGNRCHRRARHLPAAFRRELPALPRPGRRARSGHSRHAARRQHPRAASWARRQSRRRRPCVERAGRLRANRPRRPDRGWTASRSP